MTRRQRTAPEKMRLAIKAARDSIPFDTGGQTFDDRWATHKREEIELEERKLQRLGMIPGPN